MWCNLRYNQQQDGLLAYYKINKTRRALLHIIIRASVQYGIKRTDLCYLPQNSAEIHACAGIVSAGWFVQARCSSKIRKNKLFIF